MDNIVKKTFEITELEDRLEMGAWGGQKDAPNTCCHNDHCDCSCTAQESTVEK